VSLITFYCGPSYWHQHDWWESITTMLPFLKTDFNLPMIRNCDIFIGITALCMIQEIVIKSIYIVRKYGFSATVNLLPFVSLATCTMMISDTNSKIWIDMPRTCLHLSSILFVEMTTDLMLKHMTKQHYQPIRFVMIPLVVFTLMIRMNVWPHSYISIDQFLLMYTSITGTYLVIKSIILIQEMCIVLNIWCFTIGRRRHISNPKNNNNNNLSTTALSKECKSE
jgi:hypothetical protein